MAETFYSLLGVDRDADTEAVRQAYRDQVKETHPDVSDDDDAADAFKRLTDARDVLVDAERRRRYDRLGHDTYVRRHLDSTAWSAETDGDRTGRSRRSDRSASGTRSQDGSAGTSGRSTGGSNADRTRSGRRSRTDSANGRSGDSSGSRSGTSGSRTSASTDASGTSAWSTDTDDSWSTSRTRAAAGSSADPRDRARADGWRTAHAATNTYRPSGREQTTGTATEHATPFSSTLVRIAPWLAFHLVFLISAFVTTWLLVSWMPSITVLFLAVLLLGGTVFFSVLHMVSQIYS